MPELQAENYKGVVIQRDEFPGAEKEELINVILARIADSVGIEIPQDVIESEAALLLQGYTAQRRYQNMGTGNYFKDYMEIQMNLESLTEHFQAQAAMELKGEKVIRGIIKAENLTVTQAELEAEGAAMAARQNTTLEQVKAFFGEDLAMLERDILERKARELVYANAVFQ